MKELRIKNIGVWIIESIKIGKMSNQTSDNNKRLAKNSLLLYVRMLLTMGISLYTSRVVLSTLGFSDYGIYNVVGGFVAMFSFVNGSMTAATQRFFTRE